VTSLSDAVAAAESAPNRQARFAAVAALMADDDALSAASLLSPNKILSLLTRLEGVSAMAATAKQLRQAIAAARPALRVADTGEERPLLQLDHLPGIHVPPRYVVDDGIHERKATLDSVDLVRLTHRVILPTLVLADIDTGERSVQLEWQERKGWGSRIVPGSMVQDPRAFVKLRDAGAPVAAHNAGALARFIDEVEEHNTENIPRAWATCRMGWLRGGDLGFALGHEVIGSDLVQVEFETDGTEIQIADALVSAGTLDGWIRGIELCAPHPLVMLAVYASIAAPMLEAIPQAPNAIIDWSGATSRGKTTALRIAASVWGNPDERAFGLVQKWNQTSNFLERIATFCTHMPMLMDDTKDVIPKYRPGIAPMVYQVAGGKGRGRAKATGTQRTASWRTVLLSTGEAPLTSFSQDAGARARVVCLQGQPFGWGDNEPLVLEINESLAANCGHFGRVVVGWLADHRDDWPAIAERYKQLTMIYADQVEASATKRLARIVGLLAIAKEIGERCGLPLPLCDPLASAWEAAQRGGIDTDRPKAALQEVYSWAVSHAAEFWGRHDQGYDGEPTRRPSKGWAGAWDTGEWEMIVFKPECLHSILRHLGYEPAAVLPLWHEREWMKSNEAGRDTYRVSVEGERTRWLAVRRTAIDD